MGAGTRQLQAGGGDMAVLGKRLVEQAIERVRAVTIGRVIRFDTTGRHPVASVQPLIPRWVDDDPGAVDPQLDEVPVLFPGSRGFRLDWLLSDGDLVVLLLCDRPIDDIAEAMQGPQILDPQVGPTPPPRMHDLSDALAIPLATFAHAAAADAVAAQIAVDIAALPKAAAGSTDYLQSFVRRIFAGIVANIEINAVTVPANPADPVQVAVDAGVNTGSGSVS